MTTPAIRTLIRELLTAGESPDEIVAAVLASEEFGGYAYALVGWQVSSVARDMTRRQEEAVDQTLASAKTAGDRAAARRQLVAHSFVLPDGRVVGWLDATADDHDDRASWLESTASAVMVTARRHRDAAAEIRKAKATCLADLDKVAA